MFWEEKSTVLEKASYQKKKKNKSENIQYNGKTGDGVCSGHN